jgi:threonine aldolase
MYSFKNDYSEGAHPRILKALFETNLEQLDGYGEDHYTVKAVEL